jgi:hypothetical protein
VWLGTSLSPDVRVSRFAAQSERTISRATGAAFLACSWTWVIGMYLPVLLIEDFGWPGWIAFVVPNVIGAASVGFLLRSRAAGDDFLRQHRIAITLFGIATLCLHGYFLGGVHAMFGIGEAVGRNTTEQWAINISIAVVPIGIGWLGVRARGNVLPRLAWLALALSIAVLALGWRTTNGQTFTVPPASGAYPPLQLAGLAPALALGFLTCPFLDASLLRIRRSFDDARIPFAVGFFVPFLGLVTMTALYAQGMLGIGVLSWYVLAHIAVQSCFTIASHMREMPELLPRRGVASGRSGVGLLLGLVLLCVIAGAATLLFGAFDLGYTVLLSLYALPFPAYVWIVCLGWGLPMKARLVALAAALVLATPFFVYGALLEHWMWLIPGVGLVLAAPLVARVIARASDQ